MRIDMRMDRRYFQWNCTFDLYFFLTRFIWDWLFSKWNSIPMEAEQWWIALEVIYFFVAVDTWLVKLSTVELLYQSKMPQKGFEWKSWFNYLRVSWEISKIVHLFRSKYAYNIFYYFKGFTLEYAIILWQTFTFPCWHTLWKMRGSINSS